MRLSYFAATAVLIVGAIADFDIWFYTCATGVEGGTWTDRSVSATNGDGCNGCGFGRNPCNCNEAWELRTGRDAGTYEIWAPWGNIGWCKPEGGKNIACNAWNYSCWKQKTHICYTANCGPHKRDLGEFDGLDGWNPTAPEDKGELLTQDQYLASVKRDFPEISAAGLTGKKMSRMERFVGGEITN